MRASGTGGVALEIREFTRADVAATADLWVKAYRNWQPPASAALGRYIEKIYLDNPWRDLNVPCLVCEDAAGQIVGFVGVCPRPMLFRGRPITTAALSAIMVDPSRRGQSIGSRLMERIFAGPQELLYTDGANTSTARLWKAAGGEVCLLYSCQWVRLLRPGAHVLSLASHRRALRPVSLGLRPGAAVLDALAVRAPLGPFRLPKATAEGHEASPAEILECINQFHVGRSLTPVYDLPSFTWLLDDCAQATQRGRLEAIVVTDPDSGQRLGWYLLFAKRGGVSQVMQLGGAESTVAGVIAHLLHRAWGHGSRAVRGQFEPAFVEPLFQAHCGFSYSEIGVLFHCQDKEIARAIHGGDTTLSRLDGEWWMHFADEPSIWR